MMNAYLTAVLLILALLIGWVAIQGAARRFAARHPEHGPAREEGGGCCGAHCRHRDNCPRD
jgi:hypothetical protein